MEGGASREEPPDGGLTEAFVERWRSAAYNCFSSGHKFCREVCPVMQVTRDEAHTPTAFHANVVGMEQGMLGVEDVARDYVHCTQWGLRAALPEHPLHRGLLPLPHPHGGSGEGDAGWRSTPGSTSRAGRSGTGSRTSGATSRC